MKYKHEGSYIQTQRHNPWKLVGMGGIIFVVVVFPVAQDQDQLEDLSCSFFFFHFDPNYIPPTNS